MIATTLSLALLGLAEQAAAAPGRIAPGESLRLHIEGTQTHAFVMPVPAGAFVRIVVEQEGVDVLLRVEGPANTVVESDVVEGPQGRESVSAVVASDGEVRIEVRGKVTGGAEGGVTLAAEAATAPTEVHRDRIEAEAALRNAARLRKEGKAASYQGAVEQYEKAVRLSRGLGDVFGVAFALLGEGLARTHLGEYRPAIALLEASIDAWQSLELPALEAVAVHGLGTACYYTGDFDSALQLYLAALPLRRAAGDRAGEIRSLGSVGAAYGALGHLPKSLEYTEQALAMKRAAGDRSEEANILHNLALSYHLMGQMQRALDLLHEALPLAGRGVPSAPHEKGAILNSLASAYGSLGEGDEALAYYRRALQAWREVGHRPGEASTLENMGLEYVERGDVAAALDHYQRALAIHRALGVGGHTALLKLADVHRRGRDLDRSQELAEEALRTAEPGGYTLYQAEGHRILGQVRADRGDFAGALDHQTRALALARGMGEREGEALSLRELARIRGAQGDLDQARELLEEALALFAAVRADLRGVELRASFAGKTGSVQEDYVDLLVRLHEREPGGGWLVRAFEASERGRAQTLVETLAAARAGAAEGVVSEPAARARSLQHQLAMRLDRQLRVLTRPHTEAEERAERTAVETLRSELRAAREQMSAAGPRLAALEQPSVLSLRELQERVLDPGTVVLEYALGSERSFLFVVGTTSLGLHVLPRRELLEKAVADALAALTRPPRTDGAAQARTALQKLSAELLGPAAAEIEGKRLVVVPDGPLQGLPFAALPSPARPGEALVERHQVVAVPSVSLVALLRSEAGQRPRPTRSVVVFADPVFTKDDERMGRKASGAPMPRNLTRAIAEAGMGTEGLGRLPFTRKEATAIADLAGDGRAVLDFEASRQNVATADLARYRYVHFATHGFLNSAHPDLSGIVLSLFDRKGAPRAGFLSAGDVFNLELSADLVVLSGCRTALGRQIRGEGVVGLTRAFMYAGSSRVLASLWKVDDAATAKLMERLYEGLLRDSLSPAEALQRAQRETARRKRRHHPYYWAAFQLQGDWK